MAESIHPDTRLGAVHLTVSDLERSMNFYRSVLGLKLHRRQNGIAYLGAGGEALLVLTEIAGARKVWGTTGLYHFAILVPIRLQLAQVLKSIAESRRPVEGFADHLVSEAIYLPDPDGNGIEVYRDRPREDWQWENGHLRMATDPLDISGLLAELEDHSEDWSGLHPETKIGHVHLHVADLDASENFYHGILGFDLMVRLGHSAGFVSAGGYHHHIGYNIWAGTGAPAPPPDSVGLRYFVIRFPSKEELDKVLERVVEAGIMVEKMGPGELVRDPSQNAMLLTANASTEPRTEKDVLH